jgi:HD-like signal output (HDOD) protein
LTLSRAAPDSAPPQERRVADRYLAAAVQATVPASARHTSALLALCSTPTANAAQLSAAALADVGVTIQLLRRGNTAFFFRARRQIISVQHVLVLLGIDNISELIRGLPVIKENGLRMPSEDPLLMLLGRSALAAAVAKELAALAGQETQRVVVCAMLQSLGAILIGVIHPRAARLMWSLRSQRRAADRVARRLVGRRPVELGVAVARQWNLPGIVRLAMLSPKTPPPGAKTPQVHPAVMLARELQVWLQTAEMGGLRRRQETHVANLIKTLGKTAPEFSKAAQKGIVAFQEQNPFLHELLRREGLFNRLHI